MIEKEHREIIFHPRDDHFLVEVNHGHHPCGKRINACVKSIIARSAATGDRSLNINGRTTGRPTFVFMRKFASLTLHKEREREREVSARDPLSPTLSHGALGRVQPATVIYHRSNLPGNSSHSAERSNEFVAR